MLLPLVYSGVHVTLESLLKDKELKSNISEVVRCSGRSYPLQGEAEAVIPEKATHEKKSPSAVLLNGGEAPQKEPVSV